MPRASDKRKSVTIYPSRELADRLAALADREHRSVNAQVLSMLEKLPELQEARNGTA